MSLGICAFSDLFSVTGAISSDTVGQLEPVWQSVFFFSTGVLTSFYFKQFQEEKKELQCCGRLRRILVEAVSSAISQVGSWEEMCRHSQVLHCSLSTAQQKPLMLQSNQSNN